MQHTLDHRYDVHKVGNEFYYKCVVSFEYHDYYSTQIFSFQASFLGQLLSVSENNLKLK